MKILRPSRHSLIQNDQHVDEQEPVTKQNQDAHYSPYRKRPYSIEENNNMSAMDAITLVRKLPVKRHKTAPELKCPRSKSNASTSTCIESALDDSDYDELDESNILRRSISSQQSILSMKIQNSCSGEYFTPKLHRSTARRLNIVVRAY